jgi:hypothetical protein
MVIWLTPFDCGLLQQHLRLTVKMRGRVMRIEQQRDAMYGGANAKPTVLAPYRDVAYRRKVNAR